MSGRRPFALIYLDALDVVARDVPAANRSSARNVVLTLAEAASRRRDPDRGEGDTLGKLSELSGISQRRLRGYLQQLQALGLVTNEARKDESGRDLPSLYVLRDAGSDVMSDRSDGRLLVLSDPTRARLTGVKEEEKESPLAPQGEPQFQLGVRGTGLRSVVAGFPTPPPEQGGRQRDRAGFSKWLTGYCRDRFPDASPRLARRAVEQAIRHGGARDDEAVNRWVAAYFPDLAEGPAA